MSNETSGDDRRSGKDRRKSKPRRTSVEERELFDYASGRVPGTESDPALASRKPSRPKLVIVRTDEDES